MATSAFHTLLQNWEKHSRQVNGKVKQQFKIYRSDAVKLEALARVYQLPADEIVCSLLHQAIRELESQMPYVPGQQVIRVEEGEEIYEDIGPMPAYIAEQRKLLNP